MSIYRGQGGAPSATDSISLNQIIQLETDTGISASEAAASAAAADASALAAGISETNAASSVSLTAADALATAADVVLTHADVVLTNADVVTTAANVVLTGADALATDLDAQATAEDRVQTTADAVATAADAAQTALDVIATNADAASTALDASTASTAAANASISETNALASELSAAQSAIDAATDFSVPARNGTLNQEAVTQGESTRTGMESLLGTATTTIDTTGDLEALVISKDRNNVENWYWSDAVRGDFYLSSNTTAAEIATVPTVTTDDVTFRFQTNKKTTGTTNRNKAYTAHYNTDLGFSIVGYEGDGVAGHEIPHHLGVEPELSIYKNRDLAQVWAVLGAFIGDSSKGDSLTLESTNPLGTASTRYNRASPNIIEVGAATSVNGSTNNIISYHFASVENVSKIGKYIGTGATGNYVDCGFKAGWVMIKNLTTGTTQWVIVDSIRGDNDLFPNLSAAESAGARVQFTEDGFALVSTSSSSNTLNDEYIFLAFAETALDGTKQTTDYSYPTTADTLSIAQNTLISFANGFSASGQVDTQENVGAGVTYTLGVGFEDKHLWLYKDKAGAYGVTENRPLEGLTRNLADTYGVESPLDASLRTTAKHFDYESSTGVALASGESSAGNLAWYVFDNGFNTWQILSTTTSWLQYKQIEKRILKSWRMRAGGDITKQPKRFTIEGSNDGLNWVALDSTYTASDYVGNGAALWGSLQDTPSNTTAYLYHRINITANNGHVSDTNITELEFNTILPSDYYLVNEGIQYNSAGTPIERTYLAELRTNASGDVATYRNLPVAKQRFNEVEVHGDLIVRGDIENRGVATAYVRFDGTENPPLILEAEGVKDIVDTGVGSYTILWEDELQQGYTLTGSVKVNSQAAPAVIQMVTLEPNQASIFTGIGSTATVNGTNADNSIVCLVVFGGKD